jgi:oligopeptide transport system substrate-binding protein
MVTRNFKTILFFLLGVIVSCTNKTTEERNLKIHFPIYNLLPDPHKMEDLYSMAVVTQIYRGLLRYSATADVVPDLAQSWTQSEDLKTYRFKLKPSIFSDGTPITANHVQMSFARIFFLGAGIGADIDYIEGARKFKETKNIADLGINAIAPDLVEFKLEKPSGIFLIHLAVTDCAILPIKKFDEPVNFTTSGAFSGPYKVIAGPDEKGMTIKKWRNDPLDSKNPPQTVTYVASNKSPVTLAKEGLTDSLDHDKVSPTDKQELESRGWVATPTEVTGEAFVILNPNILSKELRVFLYSAIDPAELVKELSNSYLSPAFGIIPKGLKGELEESQTQALKTAKSYKGPKVSFELDFEKTSELENKIVEYLKKRWSHPKIEVKLNPLSKSDKLGRMFGKKSQSVIGRKSIDYPEGYSVLTYFKGHYEGNYFQVNDPKIDAALLEAVQIFDSAKREEKYKAIQKIILSHYTTIPLFFGSEASGLWSDKVLNVPSHSMGYHTLPVERIEMR